MNIYATKAIEKVKARIEYYKTRVQAWENVTRVYKKDGGKFAVLSKNFENVKFITEYGSNKIRVHFHTDRNGYEYDDIWLTANVYKGEEEATTPEQIEERIKNTIEQYNHWLTRSYKALETIENTLENITPLLDQINDTLKAAENETDAQYIIQEYITDYCHIIK